MPTVVDSDTTLPHTTEATVVQPGYRVTLKQHSERAGVKKLELFLPKPRKKRSLEKFTRFQEEGLNQKI